MKQKIFAIRDLITSTYTYPITMPSEREAKDQFEQLINDQNTHYYKHPQDYVLEQLGEYDQEHGKITPLLENKTLLTGSQAKTKEA